MDAYRMPVLHVLFCHCIPIITLQVVLALKKPSEEKNLKCRVYGKCKTVWIFKN